MTLKQAVIQVILNEHYLYDKGGSEDEEGFFQKNHDAILTVLADGVKGTITGPEDVLKEISRTLDEIDWLSTKIQIQPNQ